MEFDVFSSVVLYLAVFLIAGILVYVGEKKKKITPILIAFLLPVLLAGFRYSSGTDSLTYRQFYSDIKSESFEASMSRINDGSMEPFIVLLSRLGNFLHLDVSFIYIIFAAITVIFFYLTAKTISHKNAWLYFTLLLLIVFPDSLNIMRQIAAVAVQAFALSYIYDKRRNQEKPKLLLVLLLAGFSTILHYSSVLLLPVMLLPLAIHGIRNRSLYLILSVCAVACVCAFPTILEVATSVGLVSHKHIATFMETPGSIINVKFFAATILTIVYLVNYRRTGLRRDKFLCFLMLVGAVYSAVGFYSGYVGRMANFFWVFIVVALVDLIGQLTDKKYSRIIICLLLGVFYLIGYFAILGFSEVLPYSIAI